MLRRESVNLRRVVVGHEEAATKVAASFEQARMVHFPVSLQTCPGTRAASGVGRIEKECFHSLSRILLPNVQQTQGFSPITSQIIPNLTSQRAASRCRSTRT